MDDGTSAKSTFSPVTLPCGLTVPNRLAKISLYEHLARFPGGPPNELHYNLYAGWGRGGWGMVFTGNVQIATDHLTFGRDMVMPSSLQSLAKLADAMHGPSNAGESRPLAIMQLSHTGRQSPRFVGGRGGTSKPPLGVSKIRVGASSNESWSASMVYKILFQEPKTLSRGAIDDIMDSFVVSARFAYEAGFDGIQLHAAHGYLLAQFLSSKINTRIDEYVDPLLIIERIVRDIRKELPSKFAIGLKLNAGDYTDSGMDQSDAIEHVRKISRLAVDFLEISGGDYEDPKFMRTAEDGKPFFADFAGQALKAVAEEHASPSKAAPLIMVTGGFRTPAQIASALQNNKAHLVGIGRPAILHPDFPMLVHKKNDTEFPLKDLALRLPRWLPKVLRAGVRTAWYYAAMRRIAMGQTPNSDLGGFEAVWIMWAWEGPEKEMIYLARWIFGLASAFLAVPLAVLLRWVVSRRA